MAVCKRPRVAFEEEIHIEHRRYCEIFHRVYGPRGRDGLRISVFYGKDISFDGAKL